MSKKTKMFLGVILIIIFIGGFFYFQRWFDAKQMKIQLGLASDKFPWLDFSQEELNKLYPQIRYADVPTRVTPEQTYAKFREALRTNNLEMAVEQLSANSKNYQENKADLEKAYGEKRFMEIYKTYPEKIMKESLYESIGQYYFLQLENGHNLRQYIDFTKGANGDWKMDSL